MQVINWDVRYMRTLFCTHNVTHTCNNRSINTHTTRVHHDWFCFCARNGRRTDGRTNLPFDMLTCRHDMMYNFHERGNFRLKFHTDIVNTWGNAYAKFHAVTPTPSHSNIIFPKKTE